jgi:hypothetical protein
VTDIVGSMNLPVKITYSVYRSKANPSLRLATAPGARLPADHKPKNWVLMATGSSPVHSDAPKDIALKGYCLFQVAKGE